MQNSMLVKIRMVATENSSPIEMTLYSKNNMLVKASFYLCTFLLTFLGSASSGCQTGTINDGVTEPLVGLPVYDSTVQRIGRYDSFPDAAITFSCSRGNDEIPYILIMHCYLLITPKMCDSKSGEVCSTFNHTDYDNVLRQVLCYVSIYDNLEFPDINTSITRGFSGMQESMPEYRGFNIYRVARNIVDDIYVYEVPYLWLLPVRAHESTTTMTPMLKPLSHYARNLLATWWQPIVTRDCHHIALCRQ